MREADAMADFFMEFLLSGRVWEEKAKIAAFEERCDEDK